MLPFALASCTVADATVSGRPSAFCKASTVTSEGVATVVGVRPVTTNLHSPKGETQNSPALVGMLPP
jgi:hypothetical protein